MRVVVFGGRDFRNYGLLFRAMDMLHERYNFTLVIDGKATGVDTLANKWAIHRGIDFVREPADRDNLDVPGAVIKTNAYGKKYNALAGFTRNELMITKYNPEMGIAFPGGEGTSNMTKLCYKYGLDVKTVVPKR